MIDFILRLFNKHNIYEVFTPSTAARLTFVERQNAEQDLVNAIKTLGLQIILYGYSGYGKTTLIINKLNNTKRKYLITRCEEGTTLENVLLNAFDNLNQYFVDERNNKISSKISDELKLNYKIIEGKIAAEVSAENNVKLKRIIPPQLTPQRLADFFGEADCSWIIEDFHKVPEGEKKRLAQIMKIFMDSGTKYRETKIIAIGAVGTAREVLSYDKELKDRVSEIYVPLMNEAELLEIISKGEKLLNIQFSDIVKKRIINLSNGLPSVCHHLCLNICINSNIVKTRLFKKSVEDKELNTAIDKYVSSQSDTFKASYDEAVKIKRASKYENGKLILTSMIALGKDELNHNEILNGIRKNEPEYPSSNLTTYLNNLASVDKGEILVFDETANKFSFKNPFFKVYSLMRLEKENTLTQGKAVFQTNEQGDNMININSSTIVIRQQHNGSGDNIFVEK